MVDGGGSADAEILKGFLIHPHDRRRQRAFVELCVRLTVGYLRYFRVKGWSLPISHQTSGNPLRDLAIDILGEPLARKHGQPYYELFEYFRKRGVTDFPRADAVELYDAFRPWLFRNIKQERNRCMDDEDPQKAHLKRAFRDVLKTDEYHAWPPPAPSAKYVCTAHYQNDKREDFPPISFEALLALVEEVHLEKAYNRRQWCRAIFERLNCTKSVRNFVERRQLLQAVVIVNMKYVDVEGFAPSSLPNAEHGIVSAAITRARTETLEMVRQRVLAGFVGKGRLTEDYADRLMQACENYLIDLAHSSGADSLPLYFREVMPESGHRRYLMDFKYVFETLIHRAKDDFKQRLKKYL